MSTPTFRDLIGRWPSLSAFADDLGVTIHAAKQMRSRDSIAAEHWTRMVEAAKERRIRGINPTVLAAIRTGKKAKANHASGKPRPTQQKPAVTRPERRAA